MCWKKLLFANPWYWPTAVVVATHEHFPASTADGAVGLVAIIVILVGALQERVLPRSKTQVFFVSPSVHWVYFYMPVNYNRLPICNRCSNNIVTASKTASCLDFSPGEMQLPHILGEIFVAGRNLSWKNIFWFQLPKFENLRLFVLFSIVLNIFVVWIVFSFTFACWQAKILS